MFINTSERYGERETVTIADYQELNPDGVFRIYQREETPVIVEMVDGEFEVVAEAV